MMSNTRSTSPDEPSIPIKRRIAKMDEDTFSDMSISSRNGTPEVHDSPRTSVARHMGHLSIKETRLKQQSHSPSPSKRARLSDEVSAMDGPVIFLHQAGDSDSNHIPSIEGDPSPDLSNEQDAQSAETLQIPSNANRSKRFRSPPPPNITQLSIASDQNNESAFWSRADITGQILDLAAGDDGEGINGIGFRPTSQAAYARKQRRKQQINEWKAREAREARQRRFDRRHGCQPGNSFASDFAQRPRVVRFAEAL
ncbi:hypothetical protein MRB53_040148 [Persea americana]|nr:hypothetical protein MRB53_040148 [Persea americana]